MMNSWQVPTPQAAPAALRLPPRKPEGSLSQAIMGFRPVSLEEMDSVALLNRVDTKYVMSAVLLTRVLQELLYTYRVLTIDGRRLHRYQTLYFDTPDFKLYHAHVTGRADIYKVRAREYLETGIAYLEVKHKNQKRRTVKNRLPIPDALSCGAEWPDGDTAGLLEEFQGSGLLPIPAGDLRSVLANSFKRLTLVSIPAKERLTIDLDLQFCNQGQAFALDGIAVAEIKQERFSRESAAVSAMRRQGIRSTGFSKYSFGVARLYPAVKRNSQKERCLLIAKYQQHGVDNYDPIA